MYSEKFKRKYLKTKKLELDPSIVTTFNYYLGGKKWNSLKIFHEIVPVFASK